ncbi:ABC transporter permease [Ningiella sp. W23]|uniref:ABC transporter permease n=1 Tax=Ningiella sp. W23 TaxID=3023715 RepID=UPI003756947C
MPFSLKFAWADLSQSLKQLWLFCACLVFGVCLVMAAASLHQMLNRALLADTRALLGGDLEIESNQAISLEALDWIRERGDITLIRELDTMMSTEDDQFILVELLSTDATYPLYGELTLKGEQDLSKALSKQDGQWGVAIDRVLAQRYRLKISDTVYIGDLTLTIRAVILEQPDRRLSASWRGAPVMLSEDAMNASGLLSAGSRIEYEYRVKTNHSAKDWKADFIAQFPNTEWEIQTFEDRSERIAQRLSQVASGLLIVAFSTLFIGGLGVFNSISVYLQSKRETIATLKACGLRDGRIGRVFIIQIAILALISGLIGVAFGAVLAWLGSIALAQELPLGIEVNDLLIAGFSALSFGIVTAFTFALPALGKALQVDVAHLFRANTNIGDNIAPRWRLASVIFTILLAALVLAAIPSILFGVAFLITVVLCLLFFDAVVHGLRSISRAMEHRPWLASHAATRLALANMHRPGTPLRITLLSLGTALTLLVACTVIVVALLRLVETTIPEKSPALVVYDVLSNQKDSVQASVRGYESLKQFTLAPMVRGRISAINGIPIRDLPKLDIDWQDMARDEHKLSYLANNIDDIRIVDGALWNAATMEKVNADPNLDFAFVMEDREASQMALTPGDTVTFSIVGLEQSGLLTGIYSQKGIQTRFWFEAIFSNGALDNAISSHVGTIYMQDDEALLLQTELAHSFPNIITVRTKDLLDSANDLLSKASRGLSVVSAISLLVSLMVLASIMAAGRNKQSYHAVILYCLGARISYIRKAIAIEYMLLATVVTLFSVALGLSIAFLVLNIQLKIFTLDAYWLGIMVSAFSSTLVFGAGALYLYRKLNISPAKLLKESS